MKSQQINLYTKKKKKFIFPTKVVIKNATTVRIDI